MIEQMETADALEGVVELRKLAGASGFYRVRVGHYRIGLSISDDAIECVRCLHRRDIYKRFP
jgi:mRNA interferase RelE/StbE